MTNPITLLRACLNASGLSVSDYATQRLARSPRIVYYWLTGEKPIPPRMVAFLERSAEYPKALKLMRGASGETSATPPASPTALPTP